MDSLLQVLHVVLLHFSPVSLLPWRRFGRKSVHGGSTSYFDFDFVLITFPTLFTITLTPHNGRSAHRRWHCA
jgi:hypothetical protein